MAAPVTSSSTRVTKQAVETLHGGAGQGTENKQVPGLQPLHRRGHERRGGPGYSDDFEPTTERIRFTLRAVPRFLLLPTVHPEPLIFNYGGRL